MSQDQGKAPVSPMSPAEIRWRLLVSAAEDYTPTYQALWEFGVPAAPLPGAPSTDVITATLAELIRAGLVELYRMDPAGTEHRPVPATEREHLLASPATWTVPERFEDQVYYATTPAGDAAVAHRPDDVPPIHWETPG
jgi:hypothetical protein